MRGHGHHAATLGVADCHFRELAGEQYEVDQDQGDEIAPRAGPLRTGGRGCRGYSRPRCRCPRRQPPNRETDQDAAQPGWHRPVPSRSRRRHPAAPPRLCSSACRREHGPPGQVSPLHPTPISVALRVPAFRCCSCPGASSVCGKAAAPFSPCARTDAASPDNPAAR